MGCLAVSGLLLLATACGSDDPAPTSGPTPSAASSSASSASSSSSSSTTADAGGGCADAGPEIQAGAGATGQVTAVDVPSCDEAVVTTSLGSAADDVQAALGVCSIAANEAAGHGVASVRVVSADGTDLAKGTDAGDCAAS
ncbi:hypothetical protein GCM10028814_14850 [Angustibacter aerolatus]